MCATDVSAPLAVTGLLNSSYALLFHFFGHIFFSVLQNYGRRFHKHPPGHVRARKPREEPTQKCSLKDDGDGATVLCLSLHTIKHLSL